MTFKADSKGFLIADSATDVGELAQGIEGVRSDTSAILALLKKGRIQSGIVQRARVSNPNATSTAARGGSGGGAAARDPVTGRFVRSESKKSAAAKPIDGLTKAVNSLTRQQVAQVAEEKRAKAAQESRGESENKQARDSRGRFGAGSGDGESPGFWGKIKDGIKSAFADKQVDAGDMDKVDPVIEASTEVAKMAEGASKLIGGSFKAAVNVGKIGKAVIGRGFGMGRDKAVGWYRRMFGELRTMRKENRDFSKAEQKAIAGIEAGGGSGGGIWDMIKSLISTIFSPVGIAIIGGIVGLWAAMGDKISGAWKDLTAKMGAKWDSAVAWFLDLWKPIADWFRDKLGIVTGAIGAGAKKAAEAGNAVNEGIKRATGVDVKSTARKAADRVGEYVIDPAKEAAAVAVDKAKSAFGKGSAGNKAALMQGMQNAGITDPKEQAMFLAQMDHESGGFRSLEENVRYRPKQFLKLFGKRAGITTEEQAAAILDKGEAATAEAMYGGAWGKKNLGNTDPGDALKFKGRGFTQLTGRANYEAAAKATGLDLVNNPELAADPANAAKIATWYWQSRKGLAAAGKAGNVEAATKAINGGTIGIDDRAAKFQQYLAATTAPASSPAANPVAVNIPAPAPLPPAANAAIPVPVNSKAPLQVTLSDNQLAAQDVRDRRLAQIATGGVAA